MTEHEQDPVAGPGGDAGSSDDAGSSGPGPVDPDPAPHGGAAPLDDEDDLAGFTSPFQRFVRHARGWLGLLVAIAVVLPVAGWALDAWVFRTSGDEVVARLGGDASLTEALLLVRVTTCEGTAASGSAFAVDLGGGPVVVTNRHVVDRAASVGVQPFAGGPALTVSAVQLAPGDDVAVLRLADPAALPATLVRGPPASVGDPVRLVGFPAARPFTTSGEVVAVEPGRLLLDLRTDPGASGSPVVDREGRVVAQVFARTSDGRGVATPVDRLAAAVRGAVPAPGC